MTRAHWKLVTGATAGYISDGYTLGVVGIALASAQSQLALTATWLGAIGSSSLAGLFVGALLSGWGADRWGRRPIFAYNMVAYDGLFGDPTFNKWLRFAILACGILAYYCWTRNRLRLLPKWLWQCFAVAILAWFFLYSPWQLWINYAELKIRPDFDLTLMIPGFIVFYLIHVPMLIGAYSCGFRDRRNGGVGLMAL